MRYIIVKFSLRQILKYFDIRLGYRLSFSGGLSVILTSHMMVTKTLKMCIKSVFEQFW